MASLLQSSTFGGKDKVAKKAKGHILLQGHTGEIAFRSIRIRELSTLAEPREVLADVSASKSPIQFFPPLLGDSSLVPRPEVIEGLKSWGIVRNYPSGPFTGISTFPDGRIQTTCVGSPCFFIHDNDWRVKQVILPPLLGKDPTRSGISASRLAPKSNMIALVSEYHLALYDLVTGQIVWYHPQKREHDFYKLAFSWNEKWLAFTGNGTLQVYS